MGTEILVLEQLSNHLKGKALDVAGGVKKKKKNKRIQDQFCKLLKMKFLQPIYRFAYGGPLRFKRAVRHGDLFYIDDKDVDLKDVIEASLPKAPLDTAITCHWLAIKGVQPAILENALVEVMSAPSDGKKHEQKDDNLPVDIKLPVKHILSRELQGKNYEDIISTLRNGSAAIAIAYVEGDKYYGAKATINVWQPKIQQPKFNLSPKSFLVYRITLIALSSSCLWYKLRNSDKDVGVKYVC